MILLYLATILVILMIFAYHRIPLWVSAVVLAAITIGLTEVREIWYTPSPYRWAFGILTVTLAGFATKYCGELPFSFG